MWVFKILRPVLALSSVRRFEGQLVELTELHEKALQAVDDLSAELTELRASAAAGAGQVKELEVRLEETEQLLQSAQEELSQRSLEAAEALTELGEELAHVQAQFEASDAELQRLRALCLGWLREVRWAAGWRTRRQSRWRSRRLGSRSALIF